MEDKKKKKFEQDDSKEKRQRSMLPEKEEAKMYDDGGQVDTQEAPPDPNQIGQYADPSAANAVAEAAPDQQAQLSTMGKIENAAGKFMGSGGGYDPSQDPSQNANTSARFAPLQGLDPNNIRPMSIMDDGGMIPARHPDMGPIKNDPNDGHHQLAVLEEGERVLTPAQNEMYEQQWHPPMRMVQQLNQPNPPVREMNSEEVEAPRALGTMMYPIYRGGQVAATLNPSPEIVAPITSEAPPDNPNLSYKMKPEMVQTFDNGGMVTPDQMTMSMYDSGGKVEGEGEGESREGMVPITDQMTTYMAPQPPPQVRPPMAPTQEQPQAQQAQPPMEMADASHGAPPKMGELNKPEKPHEMVNPLDTGSPQHPKQSDHDWLNNERSRLKQKMMDAAEGKFTGGNFDHIGYGEAKMALADLNKSHPWGTPENHPGFMGKVGHVLGEIGNVAGNAVLPGVMWQIPGSQANLQAQEAQGQQQISQGLAQQASQAETEFKQAQTKAVGMGTQPETAYTRDLLFGGPDGGPKINPATGRPWTRIEAHEAWKRSEQVKPYSLPIQLQQAKEDLLNAATPEEKSIAEARIKTIEESIRTSQKMTDKQRAIDAYGQAHNLDVNTPEGFNQARLGMEVEDAASKADALWPSQKRRMQLQQQLDITKQALQQAGANAQARGLEASKFALQENKAYQDSMQKLQMVNTAIDMSDTNQVAANVAPLLATLGIVSVEGGVKRLNTVELAKFVPANGSAFRWFQAHFDKLTEGQLPPDYQSNMKEFMGAVMRGRTMEHEAQLRNIDQTLGVGAVQPTVTPNKKGGVDVNRTKAAPQAGPPPAPKGAGGKTVEQLQKEGYKWQLNPTTNTYGWKK